jgi:hypothetical protein
MMGLDWKSAGLDLQAAVEYLKKVSDRFFSNNFLNS